MTGSTPIQRVKDQQLDRAGQHRRVPDLHPVRRRSCSTSQVDAVTTDDAILTGFAAQQPGQLKLVGEPFSQEPYGIGLDKDDTAFRKINDMLKAADADGSY